MYISTIFGLSAKVIVSPLVKKSRAASNHPNEWALVLITIILEVLERGGEI
jgi:hypothetical protein